MKRKRLRSIRYLTREERRNFKKNNPGYKLDFRDRFPDFPMYFSIFVLLFVLLKPILIDVLL